MSDLSVQQQKQLSLYLKKNPKISREKAIVLLFGGGAAPTNKGIVVEHSSKQTQSHTIYLQSGRKVVYTKLKDGRMACKYYGADGTQIKPEYFKKVEGKISISNDGATYCVTKNGKKSKPLKAKSPSLGQLDQNIAKLNNQEKKLNKIKKEQGFIGKGWDWFKNKTGIGDSSDKAQMQINAERDMLKQLRQPNAKIDQKQFEKITGQKYTKANLEKFKKGEFSQASQKVAGYQEGQEMVVDVVADTVSGIVAIPVYGAAVAAAPFTGGASIAIGIAVAGATGALLKVGIKAADAASGGRQYTLNDVGRDAATGAFSGVLAPVTGGMGGAVGKTVATKLGLQAVKSVGKEIAEEAVETGVKQGIKTALTNPTGYEYVGNSASKKFLAYGTEMLTDGAVGGAADNAFRTAIDGGSLSDIGEAALDGGITGAIMFPIIGGGMKVSGKITFKGAKSINCKKELIHLIGKQEYKQLESMCPDILNNDGLRLVKNLYEKNYNSKDIKRLYASNLRWIEHSSDNAKKELVTLLADLSENNWSLNDMTNCLTQLNVFGIKNSGISKSFHNSVLNLQKLGCDTDEITTFIKLRLQNQGKNSVKILNNYNSRYSQFMIALNMTNQKDLIRELKTLILDVEQNNNPISTKDLKRIFSSIEFKKDNLNNDEKVFLEEDRKMFQKLINFIDTVPIKENEATSAYFNRICKLIQTSENEEFKLKTKKNSATIENNYAMSDISLEKAKLSDEEMAEYKKNIDYYIRKAGDPSIKQNQMNMGEANKYLNFALQSYERYNSTKYFTSHPNETLSIIHGIEITKAKYKPVIRFLDASLSMVDNTATGIVEKGFPQIGKTYKTNKLTCCFANPVGANENMIIPDVIIEIHPKSESSKAHFVKGWGKEVRYGAGTEFVVIDKSYKIQEVKEGADNIKRRIIGHIILQEM